MTLPRLAPPASFSAWQMKDAPAPALAADLNKAVPPEAVLYFAG